MRAANCRYQPAAHARTTSRRRCGCIAMWMERWRYFTARARSLPMTPREAHTYRSRNRPPEGVRQSAADGGKPATGYALRRFPSIRNKADNSFATKPDISIYSRQLDCRQAGLPTDAGLARNRVRDRDRGAAVASMARMSYV